MPAFGWNGVMIRSEVSREEGMSDIKPEKWGLEERKNESQELGQSFWPVLKALAVGVLVVIGVVLFALIAACVGAHKREGR